MSFGFDSRVGPHFVTIQGLLRLRPQRVFALCPSRKPRLLAASDAAQDGVCLGSAGALAVQHRLALVLPVNDRLFQQWDSQAAKISQLELCIMMALANLAPWVRGSGPPWGMVYRQCACIDESHQRA